MEIMGWGKDIESISASKVIQILSLNQYYDRDKELAAAGKKQHKKILNLLEAQITPTLPGFSTKDTPIEITEGQMMSREQIIRLEMSDSLQLHVAPDAIIWDGQRLSCVEIKPSYYDLSLLQLMYECMAADNEYGGGAVQGLLYLYRNEETVRVLENGGRAYWDQGREIAVLASELGHGRDSSPMRVGEIAVTNSRERAVIYRQQMEAVWGEVKEGLRSELS